MNAQNRSVVLTVFVICPTCQTITSIFAVDVNPSIIVTCSFCRSVLGTLGELSAKTEQARTDDANPMQRPPEKTPEQ